VKGHKQPESRGIDGFHARKIQLDTALIRLAHDGLTQAKHFLAGDKSATTAQQCRIHGPIHNDLQQECLLSFLIQLLPNAQLIGLSLKTNAV
jgi:hypothetical protein